MNKSCYCIVRIKSVKKTIIYCFIHHFLGVLSLKIILSKTTTIHSKQDYNDEEGVALKPETKTCVNKKEGKDCY